MRGTRILRYIGNREKPEESLYGAEEILHDWDKFLNLADLKGMALNVNGLSDVKPLSFDEMSKMTQLVEPVSMPGDARMTAPAWWRARPFMVVEKEEARPPEPEFEVNMMEPLVGWRSWNLANHLLLSLHTGTRWHPDEARAAGCTKGWHGSDKVPTGNCTCGIYAVNDVKFVPGGDVYGEVYGWGRYVRGEDGWRAEFAYPKSFYLDQSQVELIEPLRKYHVPIHILTPIQCYDPSEDGYENWTNEAHGDRGTAQDSGSGEES